MNSGDGGGGGGVQMIPSFLGSSSSSSPATAASLEKFLDDVKATEEELREVERSRVSLLQIINSLKSLGDGSPELLEKLRSKMAAEAAAALRKAKLIKLRLESLERANAASRALPGCGPGSPADTARASAVAAIREKLRASAGGFAELRALMTKELGAMAAGIERSLLELQQLLMEMSVVAAEGEEDGEDDVEAQVDRATAFVGSHCADQDDAGKTQKVTGKWACFATVVIVVAILLAIVLPIVLPIVL